MKQLFLILSLLIIQTNLYSQKRYVSASDSLAIDQQLDSHFGVDYEIDDAIFVDSLENHYDRNRSGIDDEYGTLKGCIVFTASKNGTYINVKGIVGIYRDNQIIWYSDFIIPDDEIYGGGFIDKIEDINNDGKVEIMTAWESVGGASYHTKTLFVHSWNGNQGSLDVDVLGGGSPIKCYETKLFEYIDVNGDGKWEIISFEYIDNTPSVFEWDGTKYTASETINLDSIDMFFPRNNFTPVVSASVEKINDKFIYSYKVENSSNSAQSINEFDVYGYDVLYNVIENYYSNVKTIAKNWYGDDRKNSVTWDGYPIRPGKSLSGFSYSAKGSPTIGEAYLRGYNYSLYPGDYENNTEVDDYLRNSVIVKTIAAKLPATPFNPQKFLDSLINYNNQSQQLNWIKNTPILNKYDSLFTSAKTQLQQNNIAGVKTTLNQVLQDVDVDSTSNLTSEAYALIKYNTEYLLNNLPEEINANLTVKLTNSTGSLLTGGSLQYYEGAWKDAINHGDGTFAVNTDKSKGSFGQSLSLRMTYEYGTQTVSNVPAQNNTFTFQTINTVVQLKNSQGNLINEEGIVKYYAGAWRDFGTTVNGVAAKELLPNNYSFRMTYAYGSNDKQQDIGTNSTVVFQTVNANVQLKNSAGTLIDEGTVKYYAGAWRDFGTTVNGVAAKELLPNNYSFRMTYAYGSNDKQQDIGTNLPTGQAGSTVVFQTVNANVQLKNSAGTLIDEGTVKYYAGAWRDFGTTVNGVAAKELLPNNYSFRMTYAYGSNDKQQDIGTNSTVVFQTVNANVQLKNSAGNLIDECTVKYYAGSWRDFGTTVNGVASKELLPNNYSFRMTYEFVSNDKQQDIGTNSTVNFSTVLTTVKVNDAQNQPVDNADIKYYAGAWRNFGTTTNGEATKELLPSNITFRASANGVSKDKQQDISSNSTVEINLNTGQ